MTVEEFVVVQKKINYSDFGGIERDCIYNDKIKSIEN
jgi:hypothetical protein